MISAIEWVPAGVADPSPKKYELSAAEVELIEMMENQQIGTGQVEETIKTKPPKKKNNQMKIEHNLPADLRMDEYSSDEDENDAARGTALGHLLVDEGDANELLNEPDDEEEDEGGKRMKNDDDMDSDDSDDDDLDDVPDTREYTPLDVEGLQNMGISKAVDGSSYMDFPADGEIDDDSEADDVQIRPDDALIVTAKTEDDFASLEVHVYEQNSGNMFVHHDIPLPAFPLCLAHGDIGPTGGAGNFCAVGTFNPGIEIWNLDVLNALEPSCTLGGENTTMADELMRQSVLGSKPNTKALSSQTGLRKGSHEDAVMCLSWNKVHRQVIASGSADCTVKLWDITQANTDSCNAGTFSHHKDKVQSVLWHPQEGTLLATGSYDRTVALLDARGSQKDIRKVKLPADCESLAWDPFSPQHLTAASEDGTIMCWDVRKFSDKTPLWSKVASEYGGVSDLAYNPHVPGMLASCAVDKTVTIWDTYNETEKISNGPPQPCGNKNMNVGKLYAINFYPSSPWLLGTAGNGKELALWDMTRDNSIQKRFGGRVATTTTTTSEKPVEETVDDASKKEAFEAMMSGETSAKPVELESKSKLKKKKKGSKKKKAHRAGK